MSKTTISGKGTEGFTQCDSVARTMHDLDAITRTYVSLGDDPEVCAGSAGLSEAADHVGHFPETSERSARNARAADLQDRASDCPSFPDDRAGLVEALGREVLAELTRFDHAVEFAGPPGRVLRRVGVPGLVVAAVMLDVANGIPLDVIVGEARPRFLTRRVAAASKRRATDRAAPPEARRRFARAGRHRNPREPRWGAQFRATSGRRAGRVHVARARGPGAAPRTRRASRRARAVAAWRDGEPAGTSVGRASDAR